MARYISTKLFEIDKFDSIKKEELFRLLNEIKPDIEIYEYYRVHNSQCCEYYLTVLLISDTFQLIDSYFYRDKTEQIHSDWKCVYYKFLNFYPFILVRIKELMHRTLLIFM